MTDKNSPGLEVEIEITQDGSHTLFVPDLHEHYHSVFGAVEESRHIFMEAGFRYVARPGKTISILEIGFGTGLNALLTFIETIPCKCQVEYTAVELNPLKKEIYSRLNYADIIQFEGVHEIFRKLHDLPWNTKTVITADFSLLKLTTALEDYFPDENHFDLIYFDAFGPDIQPEMWTREVFDKMASGLKSGGVLVTYSTKGTVKRNLKAAGFLIEKLPGPAGKREILRAVKS